MTEIETASRIAETAKTLSHNSKAEIVRNLDEGILRKGIKSLLEKMEPTSYVELYHGSEEQGKDLVIVRKSAFGEQATAVVVVRGDIRTKSAGLVDKIISQVGQCFAQPAKLQTLHKNIKISHVWVMLAGIHSKGANTRLTGEVEKPNVNLFDLNWLVEKFTEYYPHIFFESRISEFIEDKINDLESQHLLKDKVKYLTDYYVPQTIGNLDQIIEFSAEDVFSLISEIKPFEIIKTDLNAGAKILLAGEPGVGKSTALTKIAIDMLSESLSSATNKKGQILPIPILIKASALLEIDNIDALVGAFGLSGEIKDRFTVRALLVDALDELPGNSRKSIVDKAIKFSNELRASLLISSRKIDLVKEGALQLQKKELLPLEYGQAVTLFSKIIKDKTKLDSLKDGLNRIQGQFTMTPLTLLLLIELAESDKEIPSSIVLLYNKFFDLILGMEEKKRKGLDILFDPEIKRTFLERLAYEMFFTKNRDIISRLDFDAFLESFSKEYSWDVDELKSFMLEIERAGILNIRDSVYFVHATFLDYFTASRIYSIREEIPNLFEQLDKIYFDKWWYDVVFYYAGLRKTLPKEFIALLSEHQTNNDDISTTGSKVLIGRLLQAAWQSTSETKIFGIETSQSYCDTLRDQFLKYALSKNPNMPRIYADIFAMRICETAYLSKHLLNQTLAVIEKYLQKPSPQSITKAIQLLWVFKDKIDPAVRESLIERIYKCAITAPGSTTEEYSIYSKNLLFLKMIGDGNTAIFKNIEKKIQREFKANPTVFKRLLPPPKHGFRPRKKNVKPSKKGLI